MKWYRHQKELSVQNGKLYFWNSTVTVDKKRCHVIKEEPEQAKGTKARSLYHRLKKIYAGILERSIQSALSRDVTHQLLNKIFKNKPQRKFIKARAPQKRHQIDPMDVGKQHTCIHGNCEYRYVLMIMDSSVASYGCMLSKTSQAAQ